MKIQINYIDTCAPFSAHFIYVKIIRPPTIIGHQALKNQDFKDHDFWPDSYNYYYQVTQKRIIEKYGMANLYNFVSKGLTDKEIETAKSFHADEKIKLTGIGEKPLRKIEIKD